MYYSKVTSKGQTTIPIEVRDKMSINAGDKLEFIIYEDYISIIPINKSITKLKGLLPKPNNILSCGQMSNIIKDSYDRN